MMRIQITRIPEKSLSLHKFSNGSADSEGRVFPELQHSKVDIAEAAHENEIKTRCA